MSRFLPVLLVFFFTTHLLQAQNYKKALKHYKKALVFERKGNDEKAIRFFKKSLKADNAFKDSRLQLATKYLKKGNLRDARMQYEEIIRLHPDFSMMPYMELGKMAHKDGDYKESARLMVEVMHRAREGSELHKLAQKLYNNSIFLITANQNEETNMLRLSKAVNSPYDEYHPRFSADGNMMIFTRKIENQEDFYLSRKIGDLWQTAVALKSPINTEGNEGAHCISADGQFLYFTACLRDDGVGSCDIYVSQKKGEEWGTPVNLGLAINSTYWDSQPSISADGKTLYFVSNRPGGEGGIDIWYSKKDSSGAWTSARNAGAPINTAYKDYSPFIHPNSMQMYFSSEGHAGYGGSDIFISTMKNGKWQTPYNLGSAVNDELDQNSLSVSIDGKTGWLAREETSGQLEIYEFKMPKAARPIPAVYLRGQCYSAKDSSIVRSLLRISNLESGLNIYEDYSSADGSFLICIPANQSYGFHLGAEGFLPLSVNLDSALSSTNSDSLIFFLSPIEKDLIVPLNNIFFELNSYLLDKKSFDEIALTARFLEDNPMVEIEIHGHTDNTGSKSYNKELSEKRAKSVMDKLIELGVDPKRLGYKGFGDSKPIATNEFDEGRRKNRRTEFLVRKLN